MMELEPIIPVHNQGVPQVGFCIVLKLFTT